MRIAVVSDDEATISRHFGRAPYYVVFTIEEGQIAGRETRAKVGHHTFSACDCHTAPGEPHGLGQHSEAKHQMMADTIDDCDAVIVGGMGCGARHRACRHGRDRRVPGRAGVLAWRAARPDEPLALARSFPESPIASVRLTRGLSSR